MAVITKTELLTIMKDFFENHIPFNVMLGIHVTKVESDVVEIKIRLKPEMIGNKFYNILHGGVTATLLDVSGGLIAMISTIERFEQLDFDEVQNHLKNFGTIDFRVDYLRPGKGEEFTSTARVIRRGKKVAVTRMELRNEKGEELALGTATYLVG